MIKTTKSRRIFDRLHRLVRFLEAVECWSRLSFGGFAWRMAKMKQKTRRNEGCKLFQNKPNSGIPGKQSIYPRIEGEMK